MDRTTVRVMQDVIRERSRQDKKYGPNQHHLFEEWMLIIAREQGEALLALDVYNETGSMLFFRRELISIAAAAMAAVEDIDKTARVTMRGTRALPIPDTKFNLPIVLPPENIELKVVPLGKGKKHTKERST